MKKLLSLFLVVIMTIGCFVSCQKFDNENKAPATNEELITERIETFLTAYNTGDMEEVLECLDAKTRNTLQAMMNLLGGVVGGMAGFDIDLSDLFSLGVSTTQGDFMKLEIKDINVTNNSRATATTVMNLTGAGTQTIYFEMVYEKDGWYIHDMTDRKPSGANGNQEDSSNTGDGATSEDSSNMGDSSDTGDSAGDNGNDTVVSSYAINACQPFVDGRAWIVYYEQNEKIYYYGFIDAQGNVLYSIICADNITVYNIGKGSAIVNLEDELVLIDETGEVKMRLKGQAEVKEYGEGFAWIYQNKSTITSLEHLYGVVNYNGEWIEPLQNLQEEGLYDKIEHIGNGFVGTKTWRDEPVYRIWNADKSVQIVLDGIFSDCSIDFTNGMAFVSCSIRQDTLSISVTTNEGKSDENTQTYQIEGANNCIIFADGRVVDIGAWAAKLDYDWAFYNGKVISREKVLLENGQYYQITDYTKETPTTIEFTAYPASQIENFVFNGEYGLAQIRGLDKEVYVTMIDMQGNELITPIKGMDLDEFVLAPNGYAYYKQDGLYYIVDKNGEVTQTDISWSVSFKGSGEIGMISIYSKGISYIKPNGESLFENLTVE